MNTLNPAPAAPPRRPRVSTLFTLAGVLVILGLVLGAVTTGVQAAPAGETMYSVDATGATALDLEVSGAEVEIAFARTNEATLEVENSRWYGASKWSLVRDGDVLKVSSSKGPSFGPQWGRTLSEATLTLPAELEGQIDAHLRLSAGSLEMEGDVREATLRVSAGSLTFDGASTALFGNVSAGEAIVTTSNPETVAIDLSAGRSVTTITGTAPSSTTLVVSAGDAVLRVPDGEYAVSGSVAAGTRTIDVRTNSSSAKTMDVSVSAGSAVVRYVQ